MTCSRLNELIDDYVDGRLEAGLPDEVERHLSGCRDCAEAVEELRALGRAVAELPREIAPERDLLPGLRAALRTGGPRPTSRGWLRTAAAAAAVALLSASVWVALRYGRPDRSPTALPEGGMATLPVAQVNLTEFDLAESEFEQATSRLLAALDARGTELSPETRAVIEENLRIIDRAIEQVRTALEAEPADPSNGHLLNALYRQKVEFLWRVSRLSS